jgi:hypothetical protein
MAIRTFDKPRFWLEIYCRSLKCIDEIQFHIFLNDTGLHIDANNNLSGDILIYETSKLSVINTRYIAEPPLIDIEIDVNIALEQDSEKITFLKKLKNYWTLERKSNMGFDKISKIHCRNPK